MNYLTIIFTFLSLGVSTSMANVHQVNYERPIELQINDAYLAASLIERKIDMQSGQFVEESFGEKYHLCDLTILITGGDIASQTKNLGTHYYGQMSVSCQKFERNFLGKLFEKVNPYMKSRPAFTKNFNYVTLFGLAQCLQSDTAVGRDRCHLRIAAYRMIQGRNRDGSFVKSNNRSEVFFRIHSDAARSYLDNNNLIPSGINPAQIDSVQLFDIVFEGSSGYGNIPNANTEFSNFIKNHNLIFEVPRVDNDIEFEEKLTVVEEKIKDFFDGNIPSRETLGELDEEYKSLSAEYWQTALRRFDPTELHLVRQKISMFDTQWNNVTRALIPVDIDYEEERMNARERLRGRSSVNTASTRTSRTGAIFTSNRDNPRLGNAYTCPDGLIWGEVSSQEFFKSQEAHKHCKALGARLPTEQEFRRLFAHLGVGFADGGASDSERIITGLSDGTFHAQNYYTRIQVNRGGLTLLKIEFGDHRPARALCVVGEYYFGPRNTDRPGLGWLYGNRAGY